MKEKDGVSGVGKLKAGRELDHLVALKVFGRAHASIGSQPPDYSTDIAAAMPVLDRFAFGIQKVTETASYVVDIWSADGKEFVCDGISDSLPHAICLAALKAVAPSPESPSVVPVESSEEKK